MPGLEHALVNKSISIVHHIPSAPRRLITVQSSDTAALSNIAGSQHSVVSIPVSRNFNAQRSNVCPRSDVDFQQDLGPRHSLVAILEWQLVSWASLIHA